MGTTLREAALEANRVAVAEREAKRQAELPTQLADLHGLLVKALGDHAPGVGDITLDYAGGGPAWLDTETGLLFELGDGRYSLVAVRADGLRTRVGRLRDVGALLAANRLQGADPQELVKRSLGLFF
jgi:hypothetical protein